MEGEVTPAELEQALRARVVEPGLVERAVAHATGLDEARFGEAEVSLPGGCAIGTRPINLHLEALSQMGAEMEVDGGYVIARTSAGLHGNTIVFENATVGGTENLLLAATLARGTTILENAAKEPEIIDLVTYLRSMGATHVEKSTIADASRANRLNAVGMQPEAEAPKACSILDPDCEACQ